MKCSAQRKCQHCKEFYLPDRRNLHHQRYCSEPVCRRQSKAESQRRWVQKPENQNYFSGSQNSQRVKEWRKRNPGYSRGQLAEENRQKAEKAKERQEADRRKKAEEEADEVRKSVDWEKNQTRIREYLESLSPQKRLEVEIAALTASPIGRGQISLRLRQSIIDHYILDILDGRSAPE